jgi:hypothetical protein
MIQNTNAAYLELHSHTSQQKKSQNFVSNDLGDKVIITNSEYNLQRGLHALHQTVQTFDMKISHQKPKSWLL